MSQYSTKDFKKLKKQWDKKLAASGFEDIEQEDGNLKIWSSIFKHHYSATTFEAKETYYRLAHQFLHDYPFKGVTEKRIWEMHCQGIGIRDIVKALKKRGVRTYRTKVNDTLKELTNQMLRKVKPSNG